MSTSTPAFDAAALHRLVDHALASAIRPSVPRSVDAGSGRRSQLVFGFGGTRLLEQLCAILGKYLPTPDVQNVCDELRSALFAQLTTPSVQDLHTLVRACRRCPAMDGDPCLPRGNPTDPDVVVVTELPPRPGLHQQRLETVINEAGFSPRQVLYTSVVRCDPAVVRPVTDTERSTCAESYLFSELMLAQPKLIVTLGQVPSSMVLGTPVTLGEERGQVHWRGPWAILPTYAPAFVQHHPDAASAFVSDLTAAHRFLYGAAA